LLTDPNFYVALVAILALILSQFPPLLPRLRRARLTLLPFRRIVLYHFLGNPNCNLFMLLENKGGRTVTVDGIMLGFSKDKKNALTLPAQSYWQDLATQVEYPLTRFNLEPGQTWAHMVHCFEEFNREDERRVSDFVNAIRQDIDGQTQAEEAGGQQQQKVAQAAHVDRAMQFFRDHFRYEVGEYVLTIHVQCSPASAFSPSTHRLTLFESDVETMRRQPERFKYGDGIYLFPADQNRFVSVRLSS